MPTKNTFGLEKSYCIPQTGNPGNYNEILKPSVSKLSSLSGLGIASLMMMCLVYAQIVHVLIVLLSFLCNAELIVFILHEHTQSLALIAANVALSTYDYYYYVIIFMY